jgi:hypothetical protein
MGGAVAAVVEEEEAAVDVVVVREYDGGRDRGGVEEVERECEVGSSGGGSGKMCLFTDLLGDPLCRIRNSPAYLMLVRTYFSDWHIQFSLICCRFGVGPGLKTNNWKRMFELP